MKYFKFIYLGIFLFVILALFYIYTSIENVTTKIDNNLKALYVKEAIEHAKSIGSQIKQIITVDPYNEIKNNSEKEKIIQRILSSHITSSYKYIYILYKDKKGSYRYLVDGSLEDRGLFGQRLNVEKLYWDKVYTTQKGLLIRHKNLDSLWITYLYPLIFQNKVEAILAIDFSTSLPYTIKQAVKPISSLFIAIFISIFVLLLILFYQTILTLKSKKESITDQLTSVYNRTYLRDFLEKINPTDYSILMVDIDHFKTINDNYGHKVGDEVLKYVITLIKDEIRDKDKIVRYGGEEFLIFIKRSKNDLSNTLAEHIAKRINNKLSSHIIKVENIELKVTVSIGVTANIEHFKTISEAIKHADSMLYIAKQTGRNKVVTDSDTIQQTNIEKLNIEEIKDAIDNKRIFCEFQPIIDLRTTKIIKYEALVRLKDKNNQTVYPNRFLNTIFNTSLYTEMTKSVMEIVFETIKEKQLHISINFNFSDILNTSIYDTIIQELQEHKNLSSYITIELLEYELLEEISIIKERLDHIRSFNVKIALDDFGSGYANYAIFKSIPVDYIKIDGSLIKEIDTDKISQKIVKSIQILADELDIQTIAEFVHSANIYKTIQNFQINNAQGFYLGKPSALD